MQNLCLSQVAKVTQFDLYDTIGTMAKSFSYLEVIHTMAYDITFSPQVGNAFSLYLAIW